MPPAPAITVVIVVRDHARELPDTLTALGAQLNERDEVILVDNGSRDGSATVARDTLPAVQLVDAQGNVGFAGGCRLGAERASGDLLLLLNPDAVPAPGCLEELRGAAGRHPDWGAWQALVTLRDGAEVNSAGNVVHWSGVAWAGGLNRPVAELTLGEEPVGFLSGAALCVRRDLWDAGAAFDERWFMYGEDLDLSLRLRLAGHEVGIVPSARVEHDYDFVKGDYKWFYLERNRWWTVLGAYPPGVLAAALPALLALELVLLLAAWRGGWLRPKLRAQVAVARTLPAMLARRRAVQHTRTISQRRFAAALATSLDSPILPAAVQSGVLFSLQRAYWRAVTRLLSDAPPRRGRR